MSLLLLLLLLLLPAAAVACCCCCCCCVCACISLSRWQGKERDLLEQAWGAKLFAPLDVEYTRGLGISALAPQPLCPVSVPVVQNPLAFVLHSARWLGACPRSVAAQYAERATRDEVGRERRYPFSITAPFLFAFDWVVAPVDVGRGKWKALGAVRTPHAGRSTKVGLYVQRAIPELLYVINVRLHKHLLKSKLLLHIMFIV